MKLLKCKVLLPILCSLALLLSIFGATMVSGSATMPWRDDAELTELDKILERDGYLDKMSIKVELAQSTDSFSELERIARSVKEKIKTVLGLDVKIMLESPNTLQRFEGKAKRVKDLRGV